jgi:deazaflavin-dependent oxidoreductase (nitroreductase family)
MSDWNDRNQRIIEEFRANGGRVGGNFKNTTLLLLHTVGVKSGRQHVTPLSTLKDGDRWVVIASKGGYPTHPDWYRNLTANPEVTVEVGTDKFEAQAVVMEEPERSELFKKMAARYSYFNDYEQKTSRIIPVITISQKHV